MGISRTEESAEWVAKGQLSGEVIHHSLGTTAIPCRESCRYDAIQNCGSTGRGGSRRHTVVRQSLNSRLDPLCPFMSMSRNTARDSRSARVEKNIFSM